MTAYEKLMGINKPKEFIDTITKEFGYCEAPKNGSSHRVFKSKGKPRCRSQMKNYRQELGAIW